VDVYPFANKADGRSRTYVSPGDIAPEVEHGLTLLILDMDMRWIVLIKKHPDNDAKESAYLRHSLAPTLIFLRSELTLRAKDSSTFICA